MKKQSLEVEWHEYPVTKPTFADTYFVTFQSKTGDIQSGLGKYLSSGQFFQEVCGQQVMAWADIPRPAPCKDMNISSKVREANIEIDVTAEGRSFSVVFRRDYADPPHIVFAAVYLDGSLIYENEKHQILRSLDDIGARTEAELLVGHRIDAGCLTEEEP